MKLYVPSIGDKIQLTREWEFPLYFERRNFGLLHRIKPGLQPSWRDKGSIIATLEKGTVLTIDRIYIRKGKSEWDSVSFLISKAPNDDKRAQKTAIPSRYGSKTADPGHRPEQKYQGSRFWAKLQDVNEVYCERVTND